MWWNSPKVDNTEIIKLERRVSQLESDIINVLAQQKMMRDKVLRRFRGNIEEEDTESIKNFNPFRG